MSQVLGLSGTGGTTIASGANDTKGSWSSLGTASADFAAMRLCIGLSANTTARHLIDVGVAGTEVWENIFAVKPSGNASHGSELWIPRGGASGDAVQIKAQTDKTSNINLDYFVELFSDAELPFNASTVAGNYGADLGTTNGEELDPGAVANTESSPVELTTSGGLDHDTDFLSFDLTTPDGSLAGTDEWRFRVYVGATGATATWIDFALRGGANTDSLIPPHKQFFVDRTLFSSGTRVWISVESTETDANNRLVRCVMHSAQLSEEGSGGASGPTRRKRMQLIG